MTPTMPRSIHSGQVKARLKIDISGQNFDKKYQTLLLEGLDEIQQTLKLDNEISSFEEKHLERNPWLKTAISN